MNKLIVDLNKLFINNNKVHIVQAYDLLKNFNSEEWKQYACVPENGYMPVSLLPKNHTKKYDLYLISWTPGSVRKEHDNNMSVYKVLEGNIYHFENYYEGSVGNKGSTKFVDYNKFDSFQTNILSHSLHLYLK